MFKVFGEAIIGVLSKIGSHTKIVLAPFGGCRWVDVTQAQRGFLG
jgi:hypothetical protein